nr:hypothetical protein [Mesorhizobium sp. AR10]
MRGTERPSQSSIICMPASIVSTKFAGVAGTLADLVARNAGIRQCAVRGLPQARKRLAIDKPASETVSKFMQHDRLLLARKNAHALGLLENAKHLRKALAWSNGLRWFPASRGACHCPARQDCPTLPMPAYLRVMPASRYSQGRKEFFISAKWISVGTI